MSTPPKIGAGLPSLKPPPVSPKRRSLRAICASIAASAHDPIYQPSAHTGYHNQPTGADLILDPALIRREFPYLSEEIVAVLHARRCGWLSGQQLGMVLLEAAKAHGVTLINGRVESVEVVNNRVNAVKIAAADGSNLCVAARTFVNTAGPFIARSGSCLGWICRSFPNYI